MLLNIALMKVQYWLSQLLPFTFDQPKLAQDCKLGSYWKESVGAFSFHIFNRKQIARGVVVSVAFPLSAHAVAPDGFISAHKLMSAPIAQKKQKLIRKCRADWRRHARVLTQGARASSERKIIIWRWFQRDVCAYRKCNGPTHFSSCGSRCRRLFASERCCTMEDKHVVAKLCNRTIGGSKKALDDYFIWN
jgi:hypothetical protein